LIQKALIKGQPFIRPPRTLKRQALEQRLAKRNVAGGALFEGPNRVKWPVRAALHRKALGHSTAWRTRAIPWAAVEKNLVWQGA